MGVKRYVAQARRILMSVSIDDLAARLAALEARVAALEAKDHPSNVCIYAGQEYTEGAVIEQDNHTMRCKLDFSSGRFEWDFQL
jgi:hypothetical protein